MKELFPRKQVIGFVFSLVLIAAALTVYFLDMSFAVGATILLVTAFIQAAIQLVVFMHAGETEDKKSIYTSLYYGIFIALVTVFGTLLTLIWGYY
ncbi:cytochrome aa3 quinol oxidase subunit IV [Paenibacillus sp. LC231]|jgi:cytochrome aa3-600 menaquinol oxidase subunit 4|uniref:Quinol oxidase subunit 4 n=2 Tax=Paenibacillus TaxID=44249 RepID=A0A385U0C8_PAELA|nr:MULTISPECIES: cytochrome aa3 quinol oxidase subunit IV [Paenibacillus]MCA4754127.1 cytochrome aa3 quinol oxidase subunit IV [Mycolicibacterium fortuitum]VTR35834.1 Quinol oxidase subunit 4 [Actinobacillus pleuropneumoniae]AWP25115.1 cytochrome aa3 quinol oxidase subunit IV [Paenibacillus sp. Cedars]AYB48162.1 cytochrome aa3 quinol oxidase subunit IV [Paenibacillus lautus]ETT40511.1 cytochrome aa3 quinol oxidase subunit IV [Paenibacillus sp. FSL R5-808]